MQAKNVYILYGCDSYHSTQSRYMIGIFTAQSLAVKAANKIETERLNPFTSDELNDLEAHGQTQGRDENYIIEPVELNTYSL